MKKILYLVTQSELGGAQNYIADLATHLPKDKYEVMVAAGGQKEENWLKKLAQAGIATRHLKHAVRDINLWHDFFCIWEIYFLIKKFKPDVIHLNSSKVGLSGSLAGWLYKKLNHQLIKIIYTVHGFVFNEPLSIPRKFFYLHLERWGGRFKDKIICVSEKDKIVGLNNKIADHKKFVTIHNGINPEELNFLNQKDARQLINQLNPQLPINAKWIGTIANFYVTKGLIYLIRAAKILNEKYPQMYFVIIGEGNLRKELKREIIKLNLSDKIILLGALDQASKYMKAFDIFCLPSVKEGLPYVILEALAAQVPMVTTNVGGVIEIVEPDINGLVVMPEKPKELANAIEKIMTQPELKEVFKNNNQEKINKFTLAQMVSETEKIYQE